MGPATRKLRARAKRGASLLALGLTLAAPPAQAQQVPQPPTREEIERPQPPRPEQPRPSLRVEGDIERAPCALDRPEYAGIRFTPTEVAFDDLKGLPVAALRPAYASYLGNEQPVSVVCEIRDRAATILRQAGYIASVEVPEQRIADGRVRFQVLMARLVGLRVRGQAGRAEQRIASYLEPLTRGEVFNRFEAERHLLLASDIPGFSVRLALRPAGQARGEVIGEVTILHTPVMADANVQNYGSQELGRWGGMVRAHLFGLTGMGDRTTIAAFSTVDFEEQQTLQIAHDFMLGTDGLRLGGQFTYAWAKPGLDDSLPVKARTSFATIEASYPFVRSRAATVRGSVGLDILDQKVRFGDDPLARDRLRVAFLRLVGDTSDTDIADRRYNILEPRWRLGTSVEVRQGLDILNASEGCRSDFVACLAGGRVPPSHLDGDPTATVLRGSLSGAFRPVPRLTFALGARAQYAWDPLFSFEEFSAGNYTIGRGYDPGTLTGDRGAGVQAELRYGSIFPRSRTAFAAEPFVFVERAWVRNLDRLVEPGHRDSLTSVGGGLRAGLGDRLRLDVTLAVPLDRIEVLAKKPDPRLLLSFSTRLWPWSFR